MASCAMEPGLTDEYGSLGYGLVTDLWRWLGRGIVSSGGIRAAAGAHG
jgi:hypothetical protein